MHPQPRSRLLCRLDCKIDCSDTEENNVYNVQIRLAASNFDELVEEFVKGDRRIYHKRMRCQSGYRSKDRTLYMKIVLCQDIPKNELFETPSPFRGE